MRKSGFYPRMAAVNLARNWQFYGPYLFSCGGTAAMFYILCFLTWNDLIDSVRGAAYLQSLMYLGCIIVALFAAVILLYANSFVMKCRRRELGLYNILGMEKRHIARVMVWETLMSAAAAMVGGLLAGIVLSKLILLLLLKLVRIPVAMGFEISLPGIGYTAALFAALFLLTLLSNLFRLGRSRPIELLHSTSVGEREPKTKRLLTFVGILSLAGGYGIALKVQDPAEALVFFFVAVLLVMLGTYCLFTAGSIALLKRLRANRAFYYQTNHFTAVAGMFYRMKQNAVGLANICILATMVLVTVSSTVCLYLGMEDSLDTMFPHDIEVTEHLAGQGTDPEGTFAKVQEEVAASGRKVEYLSYDTLTTLRGWRSGGTVEFAASDGIFTELEIFTADEYGRLTGETVSLKEGEVLVHSTDQALPGTLSVGGLPFQVKGRLKAFTEETNAAVISNMENVEMVVADEAVVERLKEAAGGGYTAFRIRMDIDGTDAEKIACANAILGVSDGAFSLTSRQDNALDIYTMYGGFLFLGLFLGLLFLMTTVLIIYYKQVSEGYEDRKRFEIMQQVGMSPREVRSSIRSQILIVFFLPLAMAGLHILAAFPMISKLLRLFQLTNITLFALCTAGTLLAFCLIYALVYWATARTYYRIVQKPGF
ncbi:FtsX-like permease family protein [Oscillibacter sp. MSJ-2]|uniref:FtsX-like permease family protein n=1 Tax=Dysosmobacter acutus TaxID=2841504 RepID=A0ABS6FC49_9FIRM|nr:FtsX-like permease family protein [Dysosmobacter acutus]MBU5627643.1 FtsX-like permease family protein [Dysosmobacter acutus]